MRLTKLWFSYKVPRSQSSVAEDNVISATTMDRMLGLSWGFSCVHALARWAIWKKETILEMDDYKSGKQADMVSLTRLSLFTFRTASIGYSLRFGSISFCNSSFGSGWLKTPSNCRNQDSKKLLGPDEEYYYEGTKKIIEAKRRWQSIERTVRSLNLIFIQEPHHAHAVNMLYLNTMDSDTKYGFQCQQLGSFMMEMLMNKMSIRKRVKNRVRLQE